MPGRLPHAATKGNSRSGPINGAGKVESKLPAIPKRKFPSYDETPLAVAGTPEVCEYMAIGVVNDEEIGQMSEIKEVCAG